MQGQAVGKMKQRLRGLDWSLLKGSIVLSVGSGVARVLAMAFWLILARAFSPDGYGAIQYIITLGMLAASLTQPVGQYVIARYIGKYRSDEQVLAVKMSNIWLFLLIITTLSLLISVPVLLISGRYDYGAIVVFGGVTLFYAYWGLSSGFSDSGRLTLFYLASNLAQLALVAAAIYIFRIYSPTLMAVIYGVSYLPALYLIQRFRPFAVSFRPADVSRGELRQLLDYSGSMWVSHIAFSISVALPVLLLEHYVGNAAVGVFSLGVTLMAVFGIVNSSLTTMLMPKMAGLTRERRHRLMRNMLVLVGFGNIVMFAGFIVIVRWLVTTLFGPEYSTAIDAYVVLAVNSAIGGLVAITTANLLGGGNVRLDALSRVAGLAAMALFGMWLIPIYAELGAALASSAALMATIATVLGGWGYAWYRQRRAQGA